MPANAYYGVQTQRAVQNFPISGLRPYPAFIWSMGAIKHNDVLGAHGVGIICLDHSECEIEHNTVVGTRRDPNGDESRAGVAIEAHFFAQAKVAHNTVVASPGGIAAFDGSTLTR